jgi:hypothetical protein
LSAEETLEAQHRFGDTFYPSMILLNDMVELFALAKIYPFGFLIIVLPNCGSNRAALIDVD